MAHELPQRDLILSRLRDEIRRLERRPGRRAGALPCGLPAVDDLLPAGGFPRGALSELRGGPASGKTGVALALLAALPGGELGAWVDGEGELYPPAAAARGVALDRLLLVRPPGDRAGGGLDGFWAAEALLGSGAFAAVIVDVALPRGLRGADGVLRRLQAAAEKGGASGLWLAAPADVARAPAGPRIELAPWSGRLVARREGHLARAGAGGHAA